MLHQFKDVILINLSSLGGIAIFTHADNTIKWIGILSLAVFNGVKAYTTFKEYKRKKIDQNGKNN
jgi:hypothetical protein